MESYVTISDLLPSLGCRYAGATRHSLREWSAPGTALYLGTAVHKYMEWVLGGRVGDAPLATFSDAVSQSSYDAIVASVANWTPEWKVISVEQEVSTPISTDWNSYTLKGRLDAVVEDSLGRHWSLQWKTIGKGQNIAAKLEDVRMSPHEITYNYAYGEKMVGTIVGLFRKSLTKAEKEMNVPVFQLYQLLRTWDETTSAYTLDVRPLLEQFLHDAHQAQDVPRNWTNCRGKFGNMPCPLYDHCHMGLPVASLGLVPLEDRYGSSEESSET